MLRLRESGEKRVKRSSTHNGQEEGTNEALMLWEGNLGGVAASPAGLKSKGS